MTRVLIVSNCPVTRRAIHAALKTEPRLEVVGEVANVEAACAAIADSNPDIIALDFETSDAATSPLLLVLTRDRLVPVLILSDLADKDAPAILDALEFGAIACVGKSSVTGGHQDGVLVETVRQGAKARIRRQGGAPAPAAIDSAYQSNGDVIAVGACIGGVSALQALLMQFPPVCPPTLVTQHMPGALTRHFAERLDSRCRPHVCEAEDGMAIREGHIYIAPGDSHLEAAGSALSPYCRLSGIGPVNGRRPSVDVLFRSVSRTFMGRSAGVLLTGPGRDGAEGLLQMRKAGAQTFAQDEASCVAYGMPRSAVAIGAVRRQASLDQLARHVLAATDRRTLAISSDLR